MSRPESVHDHVPKREELELFEYLIESAVAHRLRPVRGRVRAAPKRAYPGFWEQAQNAREPASGRGPRTARSRSRCGSTFDEADILCPRVAGACLFKIIPFG